MTNKELLNYCKEFLSYDPESGVLTWKKRVNKYSRVKIGGAAGSLHPDGGLRIQLKGKKYLAHRLAFLMSHSFLPTFIDHINGERTDNRIKNLRECTNAQNCTNRGANKNNTSGYKGVSWERRDKKYKAQIALDNKKVYLGLHNCKHEAARVYNLAARMYHGHEFCYTNLIAKF